MYHAPMSAKQDPLTIWRSRWHQTAQHAQQIYATTPLHAQQLSAISEQCVQQIPPTVESDPVWIWGWRWSVAHGRNEWRDGNREWSNVLSISEDKPESRPGYATNTRPSKFYQADKHSNLRCSVLDQWLNMFVCLDPSPRTMMKTPHHMFKNWATKKYSVFKLWSDPTWSQQ